MSPPLNVMYAPLLPIYAWHILMSVRINPAADGDEQAAMHVSELKSPMTHLIAVVGRREDSYE
jgi:hypothetical protein